MIRLGIALVVCSTLGTTDRPAALEQGGATKIRHSFFVAGPSFTGIIDADGKEVWDSGRHGARDGAPCQGRSHSLHQGPSTAARAQSRVQGAPTSPSSSGLGRWPLTPETGVRLP